MSKPHKTEQGTNKRKRKQPKPAHTLAKAKNAVMKPLDQNHDGQIDIQDVIILAVKIPGVHISRSSFLKKELSPYFPPEAVEKAIASTPAQAGIPSDKVDEIANEVIKFERNCVSGISAALGVPGGWAMAATIPADISQYYGYTLRAAQKLLYLYGFPELETDEEGIALDSKTMNQLILCLGIMNGVAGANNAIKGMAKALAVGVEKKLMQAALTKGTFYPLIKSIMKWFGIKLTKAIFAGAVKKAIPVVGGVVGGGVTFFSFKPCCVRLKNALADTMLSNPNHTSNAEEDAFAASITEGTVIEVNYDEITPDSDTEQENAEDDIV